MSFFLQLSMCSGLYFCDDSMQGATCVENTHRVERCSSTVYPVHSFSCSLFHQLDAAFFFLHPRNEDMMQLTKPDDNL